MESDSDSDSDGSHVSATPPRVIKPRFPSLPRPMPPTPPSEKSCLRTKAASFSASKSISKPKRSSHGKSKSKHNAQPEQQPETSRDNSVSRPFSPPPDLPFQILRPSDPIRKLSKADSIETLPAGFFSKSASFSKIRRSSLNFDPSEHEPPFRSDPFPESNANSGVFRSPEANSAISETKGEFAGAEKLAKVSKKCPNLVGASVPLPPVKLRKCNGEGNFVKLNIGSKWQKFKNKGKRKIGKSVGRKTYRKNGGKLKHEGGYENEGDNVAKETAQQKLRGECERREFDSGLFEEAVSAARLEPSDENLLKLLKVVYGYDSFREGQLESIKMVLSGKSTMLVLPTGAGKTLCYQIPAMILPGITLVISPLVALMIDQLKKLPPTIEGGLLSSSQTPEQFLETLRKLQLGSLKVLFVSPERFSHADFMSVFPSTSVISLVVVDEAHCISEWSHNFRPSFMRLRASMIHNGLMVCCVLAMTATVTTTTLKAVMTSLDISDTNLIQRDILRENLQLSVSLTRNSMKDLLTLIKSCPFAEVQSIIIYCKFQSETGEISKYLSDHGISAKSYHSGIPAKERIRVQELFCSNKIRVVVATVAFGMGLDKRDVGAVIHYSLPKSLEEYVQEIGRAGRDGRLSYCHLFYNDEIYFKLRSLSHSEGVDEYAVNKFLCQVFSADENSSGKICSLVIGSASLKFDMKDEVMLTLLTRLELGNVRYLHVLQQQTITCTLNFHMTRPSLLAERNPVVAAILKRSEIKQGKYMFDIPSVANSISITTIDLSNQLQNLKMAGEITYELKDLAYCYTIVKAPADLFSLSADLTRWLSEVESCKVWKLDAMFNAVDFAMNACDKKHGCCGTHHTRCLQRKILDYFYGTDNGDISNKMRQSSPFLRADIKVFLQSNSQAKFTPRAIARIMHGIGSPAYPSKTWSKTHFWGRHTRVDFQLVMEAAKAELMNFVGKGGL